jgi:hypothetical protein
VSWTAALLSSSIENPSRLALWRPFYSASNRCRKLPADSNKLRDICRTSVTVHREFLFNRQRSNAFCLSGERQARNGYSLSWEVKKCAVNSNSWPPPSHGAPTARGRPPPPSCHGYPPDEAQPVDTGGRVMATSRTSRGSSTVCGSCGGCRRRRHSPYRGRRRGAPCCSPAPHGGHRRGRP